VAVQSIALALWNGCKGLLDVHGQGVEGPVGSVRLRGDGECWLVVAVMAVTQCTT